MTSATGTDTAQPAPELYSLLIPLRHARLIVPRACVAEVIGYGQVQPAGATAPWLVGRMEWNGRHLPLVSFEGAIGESPPDGGSGRTRVVVFHALAGELRPPYFGVLTQGFPQLVRVNAEVLEPYEEDFGDAVPVICRVRMLNEYPLVPDLERLERMILTADSAHAGEAQEFPPGA